MSNLLTSAILGDCCKHHASCAYPIVVPQHWCLFFFSFCCLSEEGKRAWGEFDSDSVLRWGQRNTKPSHLICTVYSGQDLMLMGSESQLYISRCEGKSNPLRCKLSSRTQSVYIPSGHNHLFICFFTEYIHVWSFVFCSGCLQCCVHSLYMYDLCVQVSGIPGLTP